jgi:hypothetical protein
MRMLRGTGTPARSVTMAEVKAPTARKPPWPSEICPVKPTRMLSPTAPMTEIRITLVMPSQYLSRMYGAASRSTSMRASRKYSAFVCRRRSSDR